MGNKKERIYLSQTDEFAFWKLVYVLLKKNMAKNFLKNSNRFSKKDEGADDEKKKELARSAARDKKYKGPRESHSHDTNHKKKHTGNTLTKTNPI